MKIGRGYNTMTNVADEIREVLMAPVPATPAQMWWAREYAALMYGRLGLPGMSQQFRDGVLDNSVDVKIALAAIKDGDAISAALREEVARLKDLLRTCDPERVSWLDARDVALEQQS